MKLAKCQLNKQWQSRKKVMGKKKEAQHESTFSHTAPKDSELWECLNQGKIDEIAERMIPAEWEPTLSRFGFGRAALRAAIKAKLDDPSSNALKKFTERWYQFTDALMLEGNRIRGSVGSRKPSNSAQLKNPISSKLNSDSPDMAATKATKSETQREDEKESEENPQNVDVEAPKTGLTSEEKIDSPKDVREFKEVEPPKIAAQSDSETSDPNQEVGSTVAQSEPEEVTSSDSVSPEPIVTSDGSENESHHFGKKLQKMWKKARAVLIETNALHIFFQLFLVLLVATSFSYPLLNTSFAVLSSCALIGFFFELA